MAKRLAKILLGVVLLIGLLSVAALLFVTSSYGSKWISQKLHSGLKQQTGLEVEFRNIDLEFFPPRLLLEDLEAKGVDLDVGCTIEEAEVSPDALDLLRGKISIEEIYMGAPRCRIRLTEKDMNRFRAASKIGDDSSEKIDLSFLPKFDVVALSDGQFDFSIIDPKEIGRVALSIRGLYLDITGRQTGQDEIEIRTLLESAKGTFSKDEIRIDEKLEGFKLRAALTEQAVNIRKVEGKIAGISLQGQDIFVPVNLDNNKLNAKFVSIDVPLARLSRFPITLPSLVGYAGFSGKLEVGFPASGKPDVSGYGQVRLQEVSVDDFVIGDLEGTVSFDKNGVAYSDVELATAGGMMKIAGEIAFDEDLSTRSEIELVQIELGHLLENLTLEDVYIMQKTSGLVRVNGKLNGLRLKGNVNLHVEDLYVFDDGFRTAQKETILAIPSATVRGPILITEKSIAGKGFIVQRNNSLVNADMEFAFSNQGWNLHAWSSQMDLGDVEEIAGFTVAGTGSLDCKINAPDWGVPYIDASASFENMQFEGYDFNDLSTGVRFDGRRLLFENVDVRSRKSHYSTQELELDFESPYGFHVGSKFEIEVAALDDLARSFHIDTTDWGSPKGNVNGTLDIQYQTTPERLRVESVLSHGGLTIFNEVFGKGEIDVIYDDGALVLNRLDMTKGAGSLVFTGSLNDAGDLNFMGVASDVRIEDIVYPLVSDLEVSGTGQVFAVLEGNIDHPMGKATVRLSDMSHGSVRLGASEMELTLDGYILDARGTLANRMAVVEHCIFDFYRDTFSVEAFVSDFDIVDFMGVDSGADKLNAKVTGELALNGNMEGKVELTGIGRIFQCKAGFNQFKIHNKAPVILRIDNDRYTLETSRFIGEHIVFDVGGNADNRRVKLFAKGLANLQAVSRLTDSVSDSSGKLSFNLLMNGPWSEPKFRGEASVENGEFEADGFPNPIKKVSGKVMLGSNIIRLEEFTGKSAGGTLDMNGWLSFKGFGIDDYSFNLALANLEIQLMDELTLSASTLKSGLTMTPGKKHALPFIAGDVEISNFKYTEPVKIIEVSDLNVAGLAGKRKRTTRPKLFDKNKNVFKYDIHLHGDRNIVILNNLLDAKLKIDDREEPLRLVGTNQNFGFIGRVLGVGGEVRFAGKTFEIQNAFMSFKDPNRPGNPNFRVTADVDIRDWNVIITAEGSVEEYEVKLSSQPYLPQEDIVMLLLTGMIKQEHIDLESQGLAMSLAPILESVSAGAIPVEVNVYSEYSEKAGGETTRVALGKRITKDIWVQVSSSVGQQQDVEGTLSYKFNDNFAVSASYDNKNDTSKSGNWGLDFKFRLEF